MKNDEIMVSIHCVAYNHAKYIRKTLDGFLKQRTNFNFEVLIHDDASTDNTQEIIKEYTEKYPGLFNIVINEKNMGLGLAFVLVLMLIKPLNGLLLGEDYARGLGINVERTRWMMVVASCLLAGSVTAFCGPIAFIGVAVPHIARGVFATSNHRLTVPASALIGANILLICDILCNLSTYSLPISTMSALFGAPIILWIVLKKK